MVKKNVLKPRMSALNCEFLVRPTRMEGKNFYCDIKVCHKMCHNRTIQSLRVSI